MSQEFSIEQWFGVQLPGVDPKDRKRLALMASKRDGAYTLATEFPKSYKPAEIAAAGEGSPQRIWEVTGYFFLDQNRLNDAIAVFDSLYRHMLRYQGEAKRWTHKGMPLVYISDAFLRLRYPVHSKRYLMYTLCED